MLYKLLSLQLTIFEGVHHSNIDFEILSRDRISLQILAENNVEIDHHGDVWGAISFPFESSTLKP